MGADNDCYFVSIFNLYHPFSVLRRLCGVQTPCNVIYFFNAYDPDIINLGIQKIFSSSSWISSFFGAFLTFLTLVRWPFLGQIQYFLFKRLRNLRWTRILMLEIDRNKLRRLKPQDTFRRPYFHGHLSFSSLSFIFKLGF